MPKGYRKSDGRPITAGRRMTVEQRRHMRDKQNTLVGNPPGWAEEALDFYLAGFDVPDILSTFSVKSGVFYNAIAKAALYRLMVQHQAERLEDIAELSDECNK